MHRKNENSYTIKMQSYNRSSSYVILLAGIILFICIIVFKDLLVFDKFLLHKKDDTFIAYWPNYHFLTEKIKDGNFSGWSHNIGLGSNVFPYMGRSFDPFFLISLLLPLRFLPHSFVYVIILKFILAGIFFYLYLSIFNLSNYSKLIGGLLYAFNGYMIVWGQHFQFATLMVLAPLLLYSFEMWLLKNKWIPFFIMNTVFIIFNFYQMFILIIYLIIYSIFRYIETHEFKIKNFFVFWLKSSGIGLLAFGTACIFLLPTLAVVFQSTRGFLNQTTFSLFSLNSLSYYVTLIFKFFSSDILKVEEYFGYLNYSNSPHVYAGLLTLLLVPQFLFYFKKKDKKSYLVFILIMLTLLIFPFFSYAVHGFERDRYRWTFIVILFQVYLAARLLDLLLKNNKLNKKLLSGTFGFFIFLLLTGYFLGAKILNWKPEEVKFVTLKIILIVFFFIIYGAILLSFNKKNQKILKTALIFFICCELGISAYNNFVNYQSLVTKGDMETNKMYYFDDTIPAIKSIEKKESRKNFYRINKSYISGYYNDSLIQGFNGIPVYSAVINYNLVRFVKLMDILDKKKITIIKGLNSRLYLETICSVKYLLTRQRDVVPFGYEYLDSAGDVHIYENKYYLPLGVVYHSYYPLSRFKELSAARKDMVMLGAAILEDAANVNYKMLKYDAPPLEIQDEVITRHFRVRRIETCDGDEKTAVEIPVSPVTGSIREMKHISLDFYLANGMKSSGTLDVLDSRGKVYKDVQQVPVYRKWRLYNLSFGHIEDAALLRFKIEKSKNIKVNRLRLKVKTFSSDELRYYTASVDKLKKNALSITTLEDDLIKGHVTVDNPGLLFLSIPYEKGWRLEVDGKEGTLERVNIGFMGTFLDKGYHEIELKFIPPLFRLGMVITLISVFFFIIIIIIALLQKRVFNKNKQNG